MFSSKRLQKRHQDDVFVASWRCKKPASSRTQSSAKRVSAYGTQSCRDSPIEQSRRNLFPSRRTPESSKTLAHLTLMKVSNPSDVRLLDNPVWYALTTE